MVIWAQDSESKELCPKVEFCDKILEFGPRGLDLGFDTNMDPEDKRGERQTEEEGRGSDRDGDNQWA